MTYNPYRPKPRQATPPGTAVSFNFAMLMLLFVGTGVLAFLGYFPGTPLIFVFVFAGWIASLCIHEYGHARVAYAGGDHTVKDKGYLSLDFLHYMDPMFSLVFPIIILIMGGFAFPGGAVYVQPNLLRSRGWRSAVSAAGPAASGLCLLLLLVPFWLGLPDEMGAPEFWGGLAFLAMLNVSAVLFNLLPIPGLDGYGIIRPWLPPNLRAVLTRFEAIAFIVIIAIFFLVPGVARWFLDTILAVSVWLGLDYDWIFLGLDAFYFWR